MPSVFTLSGAGADMPDPDCKWVKRGKSGCQILLCPVSKKKNKSGWSFMEGTSHCPLSGPGKRRRRNKKNRKRRK